MEQFEKLMWEDFDYRHKNFPEEASERYNEQRFKREYMIYRIGHFSNRIVELGKNFELPFNSILHVLDNVDRTTYSDTPTIETNEFITRESGKKFIYHIRELDTTGPIVYPDKYVLRFAGLPTTLMKFRQQQGSNFRYLNTIDEFPKNHLYLTVVNHNPLFRMKMFGRLPFFRITQQILASVFNTCVKLKHLNKHQFIVIPWSDEVYDKMMFLRSRKELTFTTVRRPNSFHYIFMMHLVNYMWNGATTSMFEKLDDETLSQITLILKHNDKHLFLNLKTIKDLNAKNIAYYKFVNQLNLLALIGSDNAEQHQDTIKKLLEENKAENDTVVSVKEPEDKSIPTEVHEETVINKLRSIIKPKITTITSVNTKLPQQKEIMKTIQPDGKQVARKVSTVSKVANISRISTNETKDMYAEEYINDLDKETLEFIDNNEDLTPAAKTHFKKLATKYKDCKVDGVSVEKLLKDNSDISLDAEVLDEKTIGFVPDKSALTSSTYTFEKDYRTKTFKKHFAGVISSFNNKGVFLVDVKQEVVTDPLNNYTLYTCTYEDIHSKRSSIKIRMPNIDSNDRFIADGNPQVIKKQRCVLPIVKINEREVSLASNYNKTRVVRNITKAHSFNSYVESFLNDRDKSTADIVFGNLDINESISYEYCMMASRFNVVRFTNKDKYYLTFDYYHRFNHLENDEYKAKVEKLESMYGVFFGYNSKDFFFIDNENEIFAIDKKGGEDTTFELTSLIDLLKLSLKDDVTVKNSLTEYLTIKILNAELPVITMLAYKYGLRRILDYLGIEYYITENRSKIIVGENVIHSTESFGVNSDRVAGSDELEIIYGKDWIKPANDSKPNIVIYNRKEEQDETDVEIISDTRNKNDLIDSLPIASMEELDRPVKPRLGKIAFYVAVSDSDDDINPYLVKIKGMLITVKLGQSTEVTRRVTNYDGLTFKTVNPDKLSNQIIEKAAAYLHTGKRKISMATIKIMDRDKPLPPEVAKAKMMTPEEYAKVTSKLNNENTRVGGNESFDEIISSEKRYQPKPNDIHIKFADRILHFNRYPLAKSLIVSGLDAYDLSEYNMSDFESKDAYFSLFTENGLAANYLKGIESFYDLFIDNMTYTVLKQMHEPTNVRDLLIRCAVLLSTTDHKEASSGANLRIRGYEQFNAILYNEMSREFAAYQARRGKNNSFSINPNAVYLRIIQNESTMPAEASNPLEDIKMYSNVTYGGIGGRTGESFVTEDRRFAKDDVGVLSEATADSGKVGMNATLSFDPTITNTLGVCESKYPKDLKPANVMSIHALCMPFANTDDCPRVNFNSIQTTHLLNTECAGKNRVRTGYERVVAHRVSDDFASIAEKDGTVTKIDETAKLMEVTYTDGTKNVFAIGDKYEYAESIVVQHNLVPNFKVGEKFKKQDVLAYNKGYFTKDEFTGQVDYTTGVMTNVAFMETDTTLEDSTEISEKLSAKLTIYPVNPRVITLPSKSLVYKSLGIGDHVEVTTPLMIFEEEPVGADNSLSSDENTLELLGELNRSTPTAKFSGEIVNIEAYYGGEISNMNPTLAKIVKDAIVQPNAAAKLASGSARENEFIRSSAVPKGCKFKGIEFDEDTVMLIFYIKERIPHSAGDKLVLCNQLKSTVAAIFPKPVTTESGVEVDMFFSQKGVNSRKTLSPFLSGMISRIMEKTEQDVVDEYFK